MKKFLIALMFMLGLAGSSGAQEHIRFVPGGNPEQDGELQIAVTEYTKPDGTKVTLYGVVHIADPAYYARVQEDLDRFDTVLYEGVKTGTQVNPETKILNAIQTGMGRILGLIFQKEGIDYTRPNLVHADIDADQLKESMGDQPLTPFGGLSEETQAQVAPILDVAGQFITQLLNANPQLQDSLKMTVGAQIASADMEAQMSPDMYRAIVIDRNQIVMDALESQLRDHPEKKNIAIFYGAGHMGDFVTRFEALGYQQTNQRWMAAWTIGAGAQDAGEPPQQMPESEEAPEAVPAPRK